MSESCNEVGIDKLLNGPSSSNNVFTPQTINHQPRHDRMTTKTMLKGCSHRHEYQYTRVRYCIKKQVNQLLGSWIDPVCVFKDKQYGLLFCQTNQLADKRLQRARPFLLWRQI